MNATVGDYILVHRWRHTFRCLGSYVTQFNNLAGPESAEKTVTVQVTILAGWGWWAIGEDEPACAGITQLTCGRV